MRRKNRGEKHKTAQCHICKKIGHIKFDCPTIKPQTVSSKSSEDIEPVIVSELVVPKLFENVIIKFCLRTYYFEFIEIKCRDKKKFYVHRGMVESYGIGSKFIRCTLIDFFLDYSDYGPLSLSCKLTWKGMIDSLCQLGLVNCTYIAEDKRSSAIWPELKSIKGKPVRDNGHQQIVSPPNTNPHFRKICGMFEDEFLIEDYCRSSIYEFICVYKYRNSFLSIVNLDVIRLIARLLWKTRYEKCWRRHNVLELMNHDTQVNVKLMKI